MANDLDVEKFIQAVRSRGPLWNKNDPMHRTLDKTNNLWNEVVDEMGGNLTVSELKNKWHNLRDCFRREIRTAEAGRKKRKWVYYNQMMFLSTPEHVKKLDGKSNFRRIPIEDGNQSLFTTKTEPPDDSFQNNLDEAETSNSDSIEGENINHEIEVEENILFRDNQSDAEKSDLVISPAFLEADEFTQENENCKSRSTQTGQCSRYHRHPPDNDDYHFAMSLVPHMRQVPEHRKLWMRIRITEIIAQETGFSKTPT